MKILFVLGLAAGMMLATGCEFSKSTVHIDFRAPAATEKVAIDKVIQVEELNDARGGDPNVLSYKGLGMKTSGTFVTEKPVAEIVTDALRDTLTSLNYRISANHGDLLLGGELLKLDSTPIMGFWSGDLDCAIQLNLKLTSKKTGQVIWNEVFTGFNKQTGLQVDSGRHREITTQAALGDLMTKLAASDSFKNAVQNFASQPQPVLITH